MANSEDGRFFSNNLNFWQGHGPANYERKHAMSIAHIWELPFGRGRLGEVMLTGQRICFLAAGISVASPGLHPACLSPRPCSTRRMWAPTSAAYVPTRLEIPICPTRTRICGLTRQPTLSPKLIGRNGDVRHNSWRGPGYYELDFSLGKVFTLAENKTLEFKWETYNVTNYVNLANPGNTNIDTEGAGQITAADIMRQMQFGLHFRF
jgi:hypothetical protein